MKKILLTGAQGFIGSGFIHKFGDKYDVMPVSLRATDISGIAFAGVDTVVHLSALVHQRGKLPAADYFKVNVEQTMALANAAKASGVRHFVFFSTVSVYGQHGHMGKNNPGPLNEESPCAPGDAYGESKLSAENQLRAIESERFVVSIIRPPMVYGKNCPGNMARLLKLVKRFPALPFKYRENSRSMVFIDNLLHFADLVIESRTNGILIPQDPDVLSIEEIVQALADASHRRIVLFAMPKPVFSVLCALRKRMMSSLYGSLVFDSSRSNQRLGFVAPYRSERGLSLMCAENE